MLTVFEFEKKEIRFVGTPDDPWWVATDICSVLEIKNTRNAYARLDEEEKDVRKVDTLGGKQDVICVNESGLYSLIFVSRKPQAKRFKKWVTSNVLPNIRKTGSYAIAPQESTPQPQLLPAPAEIASVIKLVLGVTDIHSNLQAGAIANGILRLHPQYAPSLEPAIKLLPISIEAELVRPTMLGERLSEMTGENWSAIKVNKLLIDQDFQIKNPDGKNPVYLPTEKGKEHSQLVLETAKGRDKTIQSLQWKLSVLNAIDLGDAL